MCLLWENAHIRIRMLLQRIDCLRRLSSIWDSVTISCSDVKRYHHNLFALIQRNQEPKRWGRDLLKTSSYNLCSHETPNQHISWGVTAVVPGVFSALCQFQHHVRRDRHMTVVLWCKDICEWEILISSRTHVLHWIWSYWIVLNIIHILRLNCWSSETWCFWHVPCWRSDRIW